MPGKAVGPYKELWEIWVGDKHVGEFFKGISGKWFGISWHRKNVVLKGFSDYVLIALVAVILGPEN